MFAGQKYECARKWNVYCVSLHWLFDSIEKGFCQDESRYTVERNASKTTRPHTSTPTGTNKKEGESQTDCCLLYLKVFLFHPHGVLEVEHTIHTSCKVFQSVSL